MAFKPQGKAPDFAALKTTFLGARDQIKDYLLFQTIIQFLDRTALFQSNTLKTSEDQATDISDLKEAEYATVADESTLFPNSRQLLAGTGITFDDAVANQRTITSSGGGSTPMAVGDGTGMMIGDSWLFI